MGGSDREGERGLEKGREGVREGGSDREGERGLVRGKEGHRGGEWERRREERKRKHANQHKNVCICINYPYGAFYYIGISAIKSLFLKFYWYNGKASTTFSPAEKFSFFAEWVVYGGTRTYDTLYSRQSALPTELPRQLSWLGQNLTSHSTPDEQANHQLSMKEKAGVMKPQMTPNTKPSIYMFLNER